MSLLILIPAAPTRASAQEGETVVVHLPAAADPARAPLWRTLHERRSVRDFSARSLDLVQVATLLWAAQGVRGDEGRRTAPSAGALYPLELYLVAGSVIGLEPGLYRYRPGRAAKLVRVGRGDRRARLAAAALDQASVRSAPALVVLAADPGITARKYGDRARRYVWIEAGAAAENVYLQATALGLGTVLVGAFDDEAVRRVLELPDRLEPVALMPVGTPNDGD